MAATLAKERRAQRQQEAREKIAQAITVNQVVDLINKIETLGDDLKGAEEVDYKKYQIATFELNKLEKAAKLKMQLLDKYVPNLKSVEVTGEDGKDLFPSKITISYE